MEVRGQGPKVKGQTLIHSHTWLWTPYKVCTSRWTASVSPWLPVAQPCDTATAWQHRHIQWDKTTVEHSYPTKQTKTLHNVSINMKPLNHIKQKQTSNKLIRCRKHWYTQHTHNLTKLQGSLLDSTEWVVQYPSYCIAKTECGDGMAIKHGE